jgi:hypothetical protein
MRGDPLGSPSQEDGIATKPMRQVCSPAEGIARTVIDPGETPRKQQKKLL